MNLNWTDLVKKFKNFWFYTTASLKKFEGWKEINVSWYKNVFYQENTRHRFHLVSPSPWPLFASMAASSLLIGLLFWMHFIVTAEQFHHPLFLGFLIVSIIMFVWFRDVIREGAYLGYHTKIVQKGLKIGFILFLVSEIMFFFCLFWAYFHSSLNPSIWIGGIWPPEGIIHFYVNDSFDTLFTLFYNLNDGNIKQTRFRSSSDYVSGSVIPPLSHPEHVYFPTYDPTACFDRIYLFYQNMFFYSPNGKIPLTYSFFFEKRVHEETPLVELQRELSDDVIRENEAFRIGSAFNYYYSDPLFISVNISSKERYLADKYVFFMFFIKEVLKESSIYICFLESGYLDFSKTENFLTKKFNTIFLDLFYKFYQAPAAINYWTFQNCLEKEVFLHPKTFSSDSFLFNERSLGEPFIFAWPRYYHDSTPFNDFVKHGLNWYLYNNFVESAAPNWSTYFGSFFRNYTFHFLDTFYNNNSISKAIGNNYSNLLKNSTDLSNTTIFQKVKFTRNFFRGDSRASDYEARYFLENYDRFFGFDKSNRLKSNNLNILNHNEFLTNNLLFMWDLGLINDIDFDKVYSMKNSTLIKKIFATAFRKLSRYDYITNLLALFFSTKNFQIQLKHYYADMSLDSYNNAPKALNIFSDKKMCLNLTLGNSKVFNYGNYFKFFNTLDNNLYKKFHFESDPLIVGAKIYNKVFRIFAYKSYLFKEYNSNWFSTNVTFNKQLPLKQKFVNYDFLDKNYFSHFYALPDLIIFTTALMGPNDGIIHLMLPQGVKFYYNIIDCFKPGKGIFPLSANHKVSWYDNLLSLPLFFINNPTWFKQSGVVNQLLLYDSQRLLKRHFYPYLFDEIDFYKFYFDRSKFGIFQQFVNYEKYFLNSFNFFKKLNSRSNERYYLFLNFINDKLNLYYNLYDVYMGGMSVFTGRYVEHFFKRFDHVYFVLSVFDKGLLIDPNKVPWINTVILITSGLAVTVSHVYFKAGYRYFSLFFLALTIGLSCFFLKIQMLEYIHASFAINDGIYGSVFYMLTGFHGFHVLVGTAFLTVCFFRILLRHFVSSRHIGFEFAIWYWHFVDVIWIGLYFFVYYWPNNYFFYYHRIWQNSTVVPTDGFSPYLCMMQYPISVVSDYILNKEETFVPHLRDWKKFIKFETFNEELYNYNRKLMSLCKYDRFQRENLISATFINHSNMEFFYNWDGYYYGERFLTKRCARDYEMWWFWEDFSRYFRREFDDYWRPWWFVLMEIFFMGKAINPVTTIRRTPNLYWEI